MEKKGELDIKKIHKKDAMCCAVSDPNDDATKRITHDTAFPRSGVVGVVLVVVDGRHHGAQRRRRLS